MKHRSLRMSNGSVLFLVFLLGLALLGANAASAGEEGVSVQAQTYSGEESVRNALRDNIVGALPWTDMAVHGTAWVPERRNKFQTYKYFGGGTYTRLKAAGEEWVHIPLPYATYLEDNVQKIRYVEFCAESSNGAITKPIAIHLWANTNRFYLGNIAWPADNNYHCHGVSFNPAVWKEALGISVLLKYANSVDGITLRKAWFQTER